VSPIDAKLVVVRKSPDDIFGFEGIYLLRSARSR